MNMEGRDVAKLKKDRLTARVIQWILNEGRSKKGRPER